MPKKFTLEELLAGVTPENVHHEVDWGRAQGKEAWQPRRIFPTAVYAVD
jgi:antitoxin MazE